MEVIAKAKRHVAVYLEEKIIVYFWIVSRFFVIFYLVVATTDGSYRLSVVARQYAGHIQIPFAIRLHAQPPREVAYARLEFCLLEAALG